MNVVSEPGAPRREVGGLLVTGSGLPGGVIVVRAVGEVDTATATTLVTGINDALDKKPAVLVVDLSEVTFFGSVGITSLIEAERRTHCPMRVVVTPAIRRILGIVGFDMLLNLYDTLDDAQAAA